MMLFTDGVDTVCAADFADAAKAWAEHCGSTWDEATGDRFEECWEAIPNDQSITVSGDDGSKETKTAREWAESNGRGFAWSTEY